jgi:hypothetical protein
MAAAQMTVTYTKVRNTPAVHRWPGGLVATTRPWTGGLPHDLGHWFIEAQVDLPWGFWALAARRAPFASFTLVEGRWPKGSREWLARVRRKHGLSMLHAEAQDGRWLADRDLDVHRDWKEIRAHLARAYAFSASPLARFGPPDVERLRPVALRVAELWDALPDGGSIEVSWPGVADPVVVPTETRSALALGGRHGFDAVVRTRGHDPRDPDGYVSVALRAPGGPARARASR